MAGTHKIFIGGGGDDWISHIVKDYAAEYAKRNPSFTCRYFSWTQEGDVGELLKTIKNDVNVTVIGHSYGADAAFGAVSGGRRVNALISIDPVGRGRPSWAAIRAGAAIWLNVRAEPSAGRRTRDDTIAAIGGKYPRPLEPGKAGAPNFALIADATHGNFRAMMHLSGAGPSGASILGGNRVS